MLAAFYMNVADNQQPQDIQVVHSVVSSEEEPLADGYDLRRAIATTVCEKVLTRYNLTNATVAIDCGDGMVIRLAPLSSIPEIEEPEETVVDDGCDD